MAGMPWVRAKASGVGRTLTRWAGRRVVPRARRVGLGRNGLRRRSDRIEAAGLLAAWLLVLALVPIAVSVGTSVHRTGLAASVAESATRRQVPAVLLADAPLSARPETGTVQRTPVPARWEWPRGVQHSGQIQAVEGTAAGAVVPTWIDVSGNAADTPLTRDQALWRAVGAATVLFGLASVTTWLAFKTFRRWLDRKRWADWDADWARVGPQWTRHRR